MLRGDDEPVAAGDRNTPGGQSAKQRGKLIGSRSADFILAREVRLAPTQAVDMTAFDRRGAPISSLRGGGRPDMGMVFLDGTNIRAHQKAAGAARKGGRRQSGIPARRSAARAAALARRPA